LARDGLDPTRKTIQEETHAPLWGFCNRAETLAPLFVLPRHLPATALLRLAGAFGGRSGCERSGAGPLSGPVRPAKPAVRRAEPDAGAGECERNDRPGNSVGGCRPPKFSSDQGLHLPHDQTGADPGAARGGKRHGNENPQQAVQRLPALARPRKRGWARTLIPPPP